LIFGYSFLNCKIISVQLPQAGNSVNKSIVPLTVLSSPNCLDISSRILRSVSLALKNAFGASVSPLWLTDLAGNLPSPMTYEKPPSYSL